MYPVDTGHVSCLYGVKIRNYNILINYIYFINYHFFSWKHSKNNKKIVKNRKICSIRYCYSNLSKYQTVLFLKKNEKGRKDRGKIHVVCPYIESTYIVPTFFQCKTCIRPEFEFPGWIYLFKIQKLKKWLSEGFLSL